MKMAITILLIVIIQNLYPQNYNFKEFVKTYQKEINKHPDFCNKFFGAKPYENDLEKVEFFILILNEKFTAVLYNEENYEGHGKEHQILTTYDRNGNLIDEFEYGFAVGGDYYYNGLNCEIDDEQNIDCTETVEEGSLVKVFNESGEFERMEYKYLGTTIENYRYKITKEGKFISITEPDKK